MIPILGDMKQLALALALICTPSLTLADNPEVVDVSVKKTGMTWRMDVTLLHPDTGWDHFADGWEVLNAQGDRLGYRKLVHPHVDEQPFTRSLSSLVVPDGTREVFLRVRCSVDGWSDAPVRVELQP